MDTTWKILIYNTRTGRERKASGVMSRQMGSCSWGHGMEILLPPVSGTFNERGGRATIDLVLGSTWVQEIKFYCWIREDLDHQSDDLPNATVILTGRDM
jgi:hypothetical protein